MLIVQLARLVPLAYLRSCKKWQAASGEEEQTAKNAGNHDDVRETTERNNLAALVAVSSSAINSLSRRMRFLHVHVPVMKAV